MPKELPISFTAEMVMAIREGRKTVTRRVISENDCWRNGLSKKHNVVSLDAAYPVTDGISLRVPYRHKNDPDCEGSNCGAWRVYLRWGKGDLLWVKESYCHGIEWDDCKPSEVDPLCGGNDIWYFADGERPTEGWGKKRSSRFMPKWVARTWLEVVSVRPERVQDITEEDAIAEGICVDEVRGRYQTAKGIGAYAGNARLAFRWLWDSINAKRGYLWQSNPWVWRIEFKRVNHKYQIRKSEISKE